MPKNYPTRNSFNSGEISDLLSFRDDIAKYNSACLTLENAVPLVEGGAKKMPGTYFAGECLGKSRIVPFQFSTAQGAIVELSDKRIRIWEPSNPGDWGLGLAVTTPVGAIDYSPATAYNPGAAVLIGSFTQFNRTVSGSLFFAAPYGQGNAYTVPITISLNTADALSVTVTGSIPNQGINVALANATPANNAATAIQAAIRALTSLNSVASNYIDLSNWTVTPDNIYYASPWITAAGGVQYMTPSNLVGKCLMANQNDEFPLALNPHVVPPSILWNASFWDLDTDPTNPIELVTPYAQADLFDLDCSTQSADVLWIFHTNYPPACVERFSANAWQYSTSLPGQKPNTPPYRGTLDVVKTGYSALGQCISLISQSNPCTVVLAISSSDAPFSTGDRVYMNLCSGMVDLNQGEFIVDSITNGAVSIAVIDAKGASSTIPATGWHMTLTDPDTGATIDSSSFVQYQGGGFAVKVDSMFSSPGDYPACGTLYQERLCLAGSLNNPTRMNGSVQGDYPDFICDPNADDHSIQFTLVSNKLDQIENMIGTPNALMLGTAGGVWVMVGANGESLSQVNVNAAKQTTMGVGRIRPQLASDSAFFVSRSTRIVIFLTFNFSSNQWDNFDLTRLNRKITLGPDQATSGISQTAFQDEPYPIFWAVRNDGQLIGLVFNKQDQVFAWFRLKMQSGSIESAAVITRQDNEDQLVVVVNRTINGTTKRYLEYFMPQEMFSQLSNAFFVHCGQRWQGIGPFNITGISNANPCVVTAPGHTFTNGMLVQIAGVQGMSQVNQDMTAAYTVANVSGSTFQLSGVDSTAWTAYTGGGAVKQVTNQVSGMTYLMGQQVVAAGDGAIILTPTTVTGDVVTFPYYANLVTIGIPYRMTVQPTNPVLSSQTVTTRGMKQKLSTVLLSLYESMGGQYGTDLNHMYDINYGPGAMGLTPAMSTLEFNKDIDSDWDDQSTFYVTNSDPLPFTLRGLVLQMSYNPD